MWSQASLGFSFTTKWINIATIFDKGGILVAEWKVIFHNLTARLAWCLVRKSPIGHTEVTNLLIIFYCHLTPKNQIVTQYPSWDMFKLLLSILTINKGKITYENPLVLKEWWFERTTSARSSVG